MYIRKGSDIAYCHFYMVQTLSRIMLWETVSKGDEMQVETGMYHHHRHGDSKTQIKWMTTKKEPTCLKYHSKPYPQQPPADHFWCARMV